MIQVKIIRNTEERVTRFSVTGHASAGPHGEDIVCAAVSALVQTALLGLEKHLHRAVSYEVASGQVLAQLDETPDALTDAVLETMLLGLQEIEKLSPKRICLLEARR